MAALPAGVPYGLSSESSFKENKELVFVKLTDSALKAIEDFIRNNRDKLAKPTIQFLPGNEGKIFIPAAPISNASSSGEATFHFSLNSNAEMEGPQGSFECVRNAGPKQLESCGPMPRRMRIHANDDSYEATKDRMARTVAAEQSKCTRVIKPNQTDIGRRVKVRASHAPHGAHGAHGGAHGAHAGAHGAHGGAHGAHAAHGGAHGAHGHFSGASQPERVERPDRMERPERPERNERPDRAMPLLPSRPHPHPPAAPHPPHAPPPQQPQQPPPQPPPQMPQQPQQPPLPQQLHRPPTNPDLTRRSIKERLIQLLALKPFKKPELYARLQSEGIKEKERGLVNKILPSIGTLKDNCYHLRRHIWNDVNEDWPFYSEEEKRILKRRKPQNLTPPLSSDSANSLSPRASPSASKRPGPNPNADELPAKKQRISHYRRPSPPSSGYATTSSGERHASDNEDERTNVKKDNGYTLNYTTVKELCPSPVKTNGFRSSPPVEQTNITEKDNDITNSEPLEQSVDVSAVTETDPRVQEEVERQYPPVTSSSSRRAYKNEFVEQYQEYRRLYHRVARVANLFTRLEEKLRSAEPLSPHHQSIGQRIVEEYRRLQHDETYQQETARFNYLHTKLTHLKRMVADFDDMRHLKTDRVSTASTTQAY